MEKVTKGSANITFGCFIKQNMVICFGECVDQAMSEQRTVSIEMLCPSLILLITLLS